MTKLHKLSKVHKGCVVGYPCGLLHIVGNYDYGFGLFKLYNKLFYLSCGEGVKGGSRRVQFYETDAQGIVHHSNYF